MWIDSPDVSPTDCHLDRANGTGYSSYLLRIGLFLSISMKSGRIFINYAVGPGAQKFHYLKKVEKITTYAESPRLHSNCFQSKLVPSGLRMSLSATKHLHEVCRSN
jgi:hypothetical protein